MSNTSGTAALGGRSGGRRGSRIVLIILAILAVLAVVLTGGAYAYAKQYDGKALPGTTVLGKDVSGQSTEEIAAAVQRQAEAVTVTVNTDGQAHAMKLADLGVTVDAQGMAKQAATHTGDLTEVVGSTFSGQRAVKTAVTVDENKVAQAAASLVPDDQAKAVDAQVVRDEDSGTWSVVAGQAGKAVDAGSLTAALRQNASSLKSFSVDAPIQESQPALTDDAANAALEQVNARTGQKITVTGPENASHEVSSENIGSWLAVSPNEAGNGFTVGVDRDKVADWVAARAKKDAVEATDGIEQVDASGATTKVITEKKDGLEITNAEAVTDQIVKSLTDNTPLTAAFETKTVAAKVTKAKAPEAAQTPATGSAEPTGEKWIDVNLSDKTLTAYVGDTPVFGPRKIVDGKEGHETITGTFHIYQRFEKQDMTNASKYPQSDARYYYTEDVPYVQYFKGGYAIHGAPWRSSFGYSGSHGCVNMSVDDAKWMYNWASEGTKVVVHY